MLSETKLNGTLSEAKTYLKETDNGKLQQFNYSRSLITNRGTVERGKFTVHVQ